MLILANTTFVPSCFTVSTFCVFGFVQDHDVESAICSSVYHPVHC